MRVSTRYASALSALAASLLASAALTGAAQAVTLTTAAGGDPCCAPPPPPPCCTHPGGPVIGTPSINIGAPSVHVGGTTVNMGGVNVNTSVNVNVSANAYAGATATASARSGATIIYGGGGYYGGGTAPAATAVSGLRLAGESEYELIEEERSRWVEEWRLVRAYCMDDSGNPHPASRPDADERVTPDFEGEIFRCVAGTALQATLGWREGGEDRFDGVSIQCQKGEALRYGRGGELFCAPQEHRRNCNERSLLRLHGPGVKLVWYRYEEHYTETVERRSESYERRSMTLMLDGGVGGYH
ncbi:hypothetical protein ACFELO_09070 [Oceanicaulis sp. LC35]|uniref:hypothetical protein n=1 Tax=Oceanicaulis sp. LC35 TaxID=3349635 RepID=UPI003F8610D8